MYFTGFADEAAKDLRGQLAATKALGWHHIEARNIDGVNLHDLPDQTFEQVYAQFQEAGVQVNCFGSAIANWAKHIDRDEDFALDLDQTRRAITRMKRLGTKFVRIMSYAILPDRSPEDQLFEKRIERLRIIVNEFLEAGLQPLHENCMNYGGLGWSYTLQLLDNLPGLKLVFDTGNPVFNRDRTKPEPYPWQSSWEFYRAVREHVVYIHIKDGKIVDGGMHYSYCGEGDGDVQRILDDAFARGYDGGISIEPHLGAVFHDASVKAEAQFMFDMYQEYGKRIEKIVRSSYEKAGRAFNPQ